MACQVRDEVPSFCEGSTFPDVLACTLGTIVNHGENPDYPAFHMATSGLEPQRSTGTKILTNSTEGCSL
jgi:hypothetical protein